MTSRHLLTGILIFLLPYSTDSCRSQEPASPQPKQQPQKQATEMKPLEGTRPLTDDMVKKFEARFQCTLPDEYRKFLSKNNGAIPAVDCVTFAEDGQTTASDVCCFHSLGDDRPWLSLEWHLENYSARIPKDTIPIAHDSCGNLWLLHVGDKHKGSVVFWDHGTFENIDETDFQAWPKVADSFSGFIKSLHEYDSSKDAKKPRSRYSLVAQAIDNMAKRDKGFHKHTDLEYIWHFDCDDNGKLSLQFVKYEIHAIFVHTDGYSRLRAIQGVIANGQPRLPK